MDDVIRAGESFVRFERPDLIYVALAVDASTEEIRTLVDAVIAFIEETHHFFFLIDASRIRALDAEARRVISKVGEKKRPVGIAVVGASFHMRVVATLINKALFLLANSRSGPQGFFDNEAAARAWIDELRRATLAS